MASSTTPATDVLTDAVRERARAEAREIEAMLGYRDAELARTADLEPPMRRQVERTAITMTIGQATGLSEAQVLLRLSAADRVRQQSPRVWAAFMDGRIDLARVRDIAGAIDTLRRPESRQRLDGRVVDYPVDHTAAELRGWLRRFVQRVEADLAVERAEAERERRHVSVSHVDDGMGWLNAYLPSHQLAAIEERLRREARRADDERTVAQREADLLAAWCTDSDAITSSTDAHIAVMIDADVLAGPSPRASEASQAVWCERQRATESSGEERDAAA